MFTRALRLPSVGIAISARSCFSSRVGKGEETRLAVLDQAVEVARRVGLSGLTIGSLADQAQLSKSGLFGHFRSKEALQLQCPKMLLSCNYLKRKQEARSKKQEEIRANVGLYLLILRFFFFLLF